MQLRGDRRNGSWLRCTLAACVVAAFTVSCGSSTDVQDHAEVGSYGSMTVNGQSLPLAMTGTSLGTVLLESGELVLTATGADTYTATLFGSVDGAIAWTNRGPDARRSMSIPNLSSSSLLISIGQQIVARPISHDTTIIQLL